MYSISDVFTMKRFSFLIAILFLVTLLKAQPDFDSLRQVIKSGRLYQEKINAYLKFTEYFELKNFDSTIIYGNKGIDFARQNADSINVAEFKRYVGVAWYFKGNYDIAAQNYFESISIFE